MRISGDNQRLRSIIGKLRRPLIRIIIPRDKAGAVCGNSMLESNPLRHLHTAFIERKFTFRRMIRQETRCQDCVRRQRSPTHRGLRRC